MAEMRSMRDGGLRDCNEGQILLRAHVDNLSSYTTATATEAAATSTLALASELESNTPRFPLNRFHHHLTRDVTPLIQLRYLSYQMDAYLCMYFTMVCNGLTVTAYGPALLIHKDYGGGKGICMQNFVDFIQDKLPASMSSLPAVERQLVNLERICEYEGEADVKIDSEADSETDVADETRIRTQGQSLRVSHKLSKFCRDMDSDLDESKPLLGNEDSPDGALIAANTESTSVKTTDTAGKVNNSGATTSPKEVRKLHSAPSIKQLRGSVCDPVLVLHNVSVSYNGKTKSTHSSKNSKTNTKVTKTNFAPSLALTQLSLVISRSEQVLVSGRTGSGKSTLFLALLQLVKCEEDSQIELIQPHRCAGANRRIQIASEKNGKKADIDPRSLRSRHICAIPQEPLLFPGLSVLENCLSPICGMNDTVVDSSNLSKRKLAAAKRRHNFEKEVAEEVLREFFFSDANVDVEVDFDLPASGLPASQRQLLHVCRALTQLGVARKCSFEEPEIVLLDEVTACQPTEEDAAGLMKRMLKSKYLRGKTVICISHQEKVGKLFGREIKLAGGRLVE